MTTFDGEVLAVIPARGGSRGLPNKNIVNLAGRPLIEWTIDASLQSTFISRTIVTTDCDVIAEVASRCGADVPFRRPEALAADHTPGVAPILDVCDRISDGQIVVVLQPTSPLRTAEDIDGAIGQMIECDARSCVSVVAVKHHPNWLYKTSADGRLSRYDDAPIIPRRQDLPPLYCLNGAIYAVWRDTLTRTRSLTDESPAAYVMPADRSADIDTATDLAVCEALMKIQLSKTKAGSDHG